MIDHLSLEEELLASKTPQNVLLLLSGGKDSVCCLYRLTSIAMLHIEAIFFKHEWSSELSYQEAKRHCAICNVLFHEIDYTDILQRKLSDFSNGRPCLICKPIMYQLAIEFAVQHNFTWIATGDSKSDATTIARLQLFNAKAHDERFFCSKYLAGEQGVSLPPRLSVVRPLLDKTSTEIESMLNKNSIEVKRNYSTGDKYFDYSREGCCLQFCDPGTVLTRDIANQLYQYNDIANGWGQKNKVRTSVHLPSTFIVTVPCGHEKTVAETLRSHGLSVDPNCNSPFQKNHYTNVAIEHYPDMTHSEKVFLFLMKRYAERLGLQADETRQFPCFFAANDSIFMVAFFLNEALILNFQHGINSNLEFRRKLFILSLEVFHTRAITINGISYRNGDL